MLTIISSPIFLAIILGLLSLGIVWIFIVIYGPKKKLKGLLKQYNQTSTDDSESIQFLANKIENLEKKLNQLNLNIEGVKRDNENSIQKVGFLRFNPFSDTGGQQSFILSLTDKNKNGVVISNLVGRSGIRWIVKKVSKGVSSDLELTDEEKKVITDSFGV